MAGNVHETWSCNYLCFLRSSSALIKVMLTQEGRIFEVETKLFIRESWDFFLLWITILFWKHGEYVLSSVCKKKRCYFQWEVVFSVSCVWKFPHNVFLKQLSTLFFFINDFIRQKTKTQEHEKKNYYHNFHSCWVHNTLEKIQLLEKIHLLGLLSQEKHLYLNHCQCGRN